MLHPYIEDYLQQYSTLQNETVSICSTLLKIASNIMGHTVEERTLLLNKSIRDQICFFPLRHEETQNQQFAIILKRVASRIQQIQNPNYLSLIQCLAEHYTNLSTVPGLTELTNYWLTHLNSYNHLPNAEAALKALLKNKNLPTYIFDPQTTAVIPLGSIEQHTEWVFRNIYQHPYPPAQTTSPNEKINPELPRSSHGIQHVCRVAMYINVLANLYRKYNHPQALELTPNDIALLQIAALFHDAGRQANGKDYWDQDSAIFVYYYLTRTLKEDHATAKLIAEAIANKDPLIADYPLHFEININREGDQIIWGFYEGKSPESNIFQDLLGDADRLDVIRSRDHFDAERLIFYKKIAVNNPIAFEDMARLITEVRSLIALGGDTYRASKQDIKLRYNKPCCYQLTLQDPSPLMHPIVYKFKNEPLRRELLDNTKPEVVIRPYDPKRPLDEENLRNAMDNGLVFARGITLPSAINIKNSHPPESNAALELRKMMRTPWVPTRSSKLNKNGNPFRSTSEVGYGSTVYSAVGGIIINQEIQNIHRVSLSNLTSGRGKKKDLIASYIRVDETLRQAQLNSLFNKIKKGGSFCQHSDKSVSTHNEVLMTIHEFDAIYYSIDSNRHNQLSIKKQGDPIHPDAPLLQALFIRGEYEQQHRHTWQQFLQTSSDKGDAQKQFNERFKNPGRLPIINYSHIHNRITPVPEENLNEANIIALWIKVCAHYLNETLFHYQHKHRILWLSTYQIKIFSVYGISAPKICPADSNYPIELQEQINTEIERIRQPLIECHRQSFLDLIVDLGTHFFCDELFFNELLRDSTLTYCFPEEIINLAVNKIIRDDSLFFHKSMQNFFCNETDEDSYLQLLTIPTSLDKIRGSSSKNQKIYFSNEIIKLHTVCVIFNNKEGLSELQEHAKSFALAHIDNIHSRIQCCSFVKHDDLRSNAIELTQLEIFVRILGIEATCKNVLNSIKNRVFDIISNAFVRENAIENFLLKKGITARAYCEVIKQLMELQWFNENIDKQPAELVLSLLINTLTNTSHEELKEYQNNSKILFENMLYLASFVGRSLKIEITQFLMYSDDWHDWSLNDPIYTMLFNQIPLNNDNIDVFSILTQHNIFSTPSDNSNHLLFVVDKLNALQDYAPEGQFSPLQLELIRDFSELHATKYSELLTQQLSKSRYNSFCFDELLLLVSGLISVQNLSFDFKIPVQFIDALHQGLKCCYQHKDFFADELNVLFERNSGIQKLSATPNQLIGWVELINNELIPEPNDEINRLITNISSKLLKKYELHEEEIEKQQTTFSP